MPVASPETGHRPAPGPMPTEPDASLWFYSRHDWFRTIRLFRGLERNTACRVASGRLRCIRKEPELTIDLGQSPQIIRFTPISKRRGPARWLSAPDYVGTCSPDSATTVKITVRNLDLPCIQAECGERTLICTARNAPFNVAFAIRTGQDSDLFHILGIPWREFIASRAGFGRNLLGVQLPIRETEQTAFRLYPYEELLPVLLLTYLLIFPLVHTDTDSADS